VSDHVARPACAAPRPVVRRTTSRGAFLVEALVAVIVFSTAAAGVFALLADAVRASGNARSRAAATDLAAATLARMSAEDPLTLRDRYDGAASGPGFRSLAASAQQLPGVTEAVNLPVVSFTPGPSANSLQVSLTVYWQLPSDAVLHRAVMTSVVGRQ
jgi:hypothetical protein